MLFGLTNALIQFQAHIQNMFSDLLDIFVVIYLDDILFFLNNIEDHHCVLRKVLQGLKNHGFYVKASKFEFHCTSVEFLGMVVSIQGLKMCIDKVQIIKEWLVSKNIKEIQAFLGFASFYCQII